MSPILVRPVREQLEHDRIIRLLQAKYKRRYAVEANLGSEQTAPVGVGPDAQFPDLVLTSPKSARKLLGVVEVETGESVNQLEAMAQWARFGKLPVEFALYVPVTSTGVAKRLCADHQIGVTEIWTYHMLGDQVRFSQVHRIPVEEKLAAARAAAAGARRASAKAAPKASRSAKRPPKQAAARRAGSGTQGKSKPKPAASSRARRAPARAGAKAARKKR